MQDKIIIRSERYNVKKIFKYALIIGIVAFLVLFFTLGLPEINRYERRYNWYVEDIAEFRERWDTEAEFIEKLSHDYYSDEMFKYTVIKAYTSPVVYGIYGYFSDADFVYSFWFDFLCGFVAPLFFAGVIYLWLKSYELTITDRRAYGSTAFGKRVDLPIDSITAIGLGGLKSIAITTASGKISFMLIKNRDEMYEAISKLIVERQSKEAKTEAVVKTEMPQSNADELKKYKELLDCGVISQEEFDAKKKQLLGL